MKKIRLLNLLLVVSSLISCHTDVLLEPKSPEYLVIDGDTIKQRNDNKFSLQNPDFFIAGDTSVIVVARTLRKEPLNTKDIEILKKGIEDPENRPLRMIAIGGGPVAGIRNGGYNNENLLTSFPSLVANQMGIEFYPPYFDPEDANGFGAFVPTGVNPTGGSLQKFKAINNNLAIEDIDERGKPVLKPLKKDVRRVDHLGVKIFPGFVSYSDYMLPNSVSYDPSFRRLTEFTRSGHSNYKDIVLNEKFDLLLDASLMSQYSANLSIMGASMPFEDGIEGYKDERLECSGPGCQPRYSDRLNFLKELSKRKGLKGVLYTRVPTHILPFTRIFKVDDVRKQLNIYQKGYLLPENAMFVYPYPSVDSLMGPNVGMSLKPYINQKSNPYFPVPFYPVTELESGLESYRKEAFSLSRQLNWAVVDITTIYRDIMNNKYISPDGYKINSREFFAEDGYSPSLLGQIVLANETIRAINKHYGTNIPYVNLNTR